MSPYLRFSFLMLIVVIFDIWYLKSGNVWALVIAVITAGYIGWNLSNLCK